MGVDLFGPGAKLPPGGGVELAGVRQWVKSLLALPVLFAMVVVVCALAGLKNWLALLIALSSLTVIFEALLVRTGVPSLVVSPAAVVRRTRWSTTTVRAADVSDVLIRHTVNGPVMVISSGHTKVGLSLSTAFRKPMARNALASFLRHAGVDLPSLRGLGLPVPVDGPRAVAGPILTRPGWPASSSVSPASGAVPLSSGEWPAGARSYNDRAGEGGAGGGGAGGGAAGGDEPAECGRRRCGWRRCGWRRCGRGGWSWRGWHRPKAGGAEQGAGARLGHFRSLGPHGSSRSAARIFVAPTALFALALLPGGFRLG